MQTLILCVVGLFAFTLLLVWGALFCVAGYLSRRSGTNDNVYQD